ncbi:hypothetical protein LZQ00_17210 [Sphingobacterium sp. SRCM116780]|uniref:hypothetical protein n=1 Tax=Sphingobacterium sp. SRCM116780 TaxID=2907623 RepID=UPI001F31C253|nr:hypothetical protein [Sphingobacterium sp. SRCM116780]UIR55989.1 hypothetical protein LZQ00_17210 [Sphingobacterium sp. SRCM116780]
MNKNNNNLSRGYVAPKVEILFLEMEHSLATGSGTVTFVGPAATENTPQVDAWVFDGTNSGGDVFDW